MKYYLSLGSNINAEENIAFAIEELKKILSNVIISSTHRTKAEGFEGDDFLNLVLAGDSKLDFDSLNKELKTIEDTSGRKRNVPKFSAKVPKFTATWICSIEILECYHFGSKDP